MSGLKIKEGKRSEKNHVSRRGRGGRSITRTRPQYTRGCSRRNETTWHGGRTRYQIIPREVIRKQAQGKIEETKKISDLRGFGEDNSAWEEIEKRLPGVVIEQWN